MNKHTLLILAASRYQIPFIQRAIDMGYRVVVSDNVPENPGHVLADVSYLVDTTDQEAILAIARQEKIAGIIAPSTDVALPTASYVGGHLGLHVPSSAATHVACDKARFRLWLKEQGFPVPKFMCVSGGSLLPDIQETDGWFVLKPDQSSGSKGIYIVRSPEEFRMRLPETLSFCRGGQAVLEQYLVGRQLTCEGILENGRMAGYWIMDRRTAPPPYVATIGHRLPALLPESVSLNIAGMLENVWARLGVTDGPFDSDLVLVGDTPYILEMSPRVGGNSITALLKAASGFDIMEYAIRWAMGDALPPVANAILRPSEIILFGAREPGYLQYSQNGILRAMDCPGTEYLRMDVPIGAWVEPFIDGRKRVGEALITAHTIDQLNEYTSQVRGLLDLHVKETP